MRSKKAVINIIITLIFQIITIICGLIVPRLIIGTFGSSVNGMIASITQFLSFIVLIEAGMGGVVRAALYQPLAKKENYKINGIIKATEKFFKVIALIFAVYLIFIALIYPYIINETFNYLFTFSLVLIIGLSSFIQYYFGMTYQILLRADQKLYINTFLQIVTLILNTILIVVLIKMGANIHVVQIVSAGTFILRPVILNIYVKRKYNITIDSAPNSEAIQQKWDALGHHVAFFLHKNTDIVILTIFTNVKMVSVYSIYNMVISGVQRLINSFSSGIEAAFGNMIAKGEKESLNKNFRIYGFVSFSITTVLFSSTAMLIIPFISIYTYGINDINYIRPIFAYVLIVSAAIYCIRLPYHSVVLAAGHFKQTKVSAILEAFINVFLSIILLLKMGMIGVALGTLIAMLYRTIYYAWYLSRNMIKGTFVDFIKRMLVTTLTVALIVFLVNLMPIKQMNLYIEWISYAIVVTIISAIITLIMNVLFFYSDFKNIISLLKRFKKNK